MKHVKRNLLLFTAVAALSMAPAATAMAAEYQTPADTAAEVTGRSVEDVARERFETGKTYGAIAAEDGRLDEFKARRLDMQEAVLGDHLADLGKQVLAGMYIVHVGKPAIVVQAKVYRVQILPAAS